MVWNGRVQWRHYIFHRPGFSPMNTRKQVVRGGRRSGVTQLKQVAEVMAQHGGFATLGALNQSVDVSGWKTVTPYSTIRRIVQDKDYFFNIKPGLWGLNSCRGELGHLLGVKQSAEQRAELNHYYYQGLLLEIGNLKEYDTYSPDQDKNKVFLRTTLGEMRKLHRIHPFSYNSTVNRARMIDVIWFNRRNMPYAVFEIEHSTDFTNALSKYIALQDFNTMFYVVSSEEKGRQFHEKISRDEYLPIKKRVTFLDYEKLALWHSNSMKAHMLGKLP